MILLQVHKVTAVLCDGRVGCSAKQPYLNLYHEIIFIYDIIIDDVIDKSAVYIYI